MAIIETLTPEQMDIALADVVRGLNAAEKVEHERLGYVWEHDEWHAVKPKGTQGKYIRIDCGGSGAFMVRIADGELFNIKGYGVPDQNKKLKADLGNIATVNPAALHKRRYNYLR